VANPPASSFVVVELTGDQRTITLSARALPYRPLKLSGSQRAEFTAYPGSPILSAQIMGAKEEPTVITGMWKDRYLIDGSTGQPAATVSSGTQPTTAFLLGQLFDDVRRKGQALQVTWNGYKRIGFLTMFEIEVLYQTDIRFSMTYTWISQGEPDVGPSFGPQFDQQTTQSALAGFLTQLQNGLNSLQGQVSTAQDQIDGLTANINKVDSLVSQVGDAITQTINVANSPAVAAQNIAATLGNVITTAQDISDQLQASPVTAVLGFGVVAAATAAHVGPSTSPVNPVGSASSQNALPAFQAPLPTLGDFLIAAVFKRSVGLPARNMRYAAAESRVAILSQQTAPDLVASFKTRVAQDLRTISATYYGTPNDWRQLGAYNGIKGTSYVPPGTLINVPRTLPDLGNQAIANSAAGNS